MLRKLIFLLIFSSTVNIYGQESLSLLVEAESFTNKGGWVTDQQFMDLMGSPYLMAHGMGVPVDDAVTEVHFPSEGVYRIYVCY